METVTRGAIKIVVKIDPPKTFLGTCTSVTERIMRKKIYETLVKLGYHKKPDFIIIGAQKGGTSGLFGTLEQHTRILPPLVKEVHYFDDDEWYNQKKLHEYHSFFPTSGLRKTKTFEASPLYVFHPHVAERLHEYKPDLKLILLLREPASRAFSAWSMYHHFFNAERSPCLHDPRPFSVAISEEIERLETESYYENTISYVKRGIYYKQIEKYLAWFKREQLLILESSILMNSPSETLKTIQNFIGVPHEELPLRRKNIGKLNEKEKYENEILRLKQFYKPYNDRLFSLIGENFSWG